ncbi:MAG: MBL fold metallo-hydrolase, partial [Prevotella sp.]
HEGIRRNYCVKKKIDAANIRYIDRDEPLVLGDFNITVFNVPHDSLENVGFNIRYGNMTFCIMTDIGHITEDMSRAISEANYLIIESNHDVEMLMAGPYPEHLKKRINSENGHLSNKQCAKAICDFASEKLKHVWLCHLSQENNHPELARKTLELELANTQRIDTTAIKIDILKRCAPCDICELT